MTKDEAIATLRAAVDKLIKAKGRFHTEQNYAALVRAFDETAATTAPSSEPVAPVAAITVYTHEGRRCVSFAELSGKGAGNLALGRHDLFTRAEAPAAPVVAPEGWKLVPKRPTPEMLAALEHSDSTMARVYRAMISAAPAAPLNTAAPTGRRKILMDGGMIDVTPSAAPATPAQEKGL